MTQRKNILTPERSESPLVNIFLRIFLNTQAIEINLYLDLKRPQRKIEMALVLKDVTLSRPIVNLSYTLTAPENSFVAILGESGSGKSSLLHVISGFEIPTQGQMLWKGEEFGSLLPSERPLTIVFEKDNLFGSLSLFDNVALALRSTLRLSHQDHAMITELFQFIGLGSLMHQRPDNVSHYAQQKTAIARSLLREKPLLLLDEPFAFLNEEERENICLFLKEMHHTFQLTTLMIVSQPEEAREIATLGAVLYQGQFVQVAPIEEIKCLRTHDRTETGPFYGHRDKVLALQDPHHVRLVS